MRDGLRRRMGMVAAGTALALGVAAREARHGTGNPICMARLHSLPAARAGSAWR